MRITVMAARFHPENVMSATRVTSYVEHLARQGHEVTVVTRHPPQSIRGADFTSAYRVIRARDPIARLERHGKTSGGAAQKRWVASRTAVRARRRLMQLVAWPDRFVLWAVAALATLRREAPEADVVISSGPPLSAIVAGAIWARRSGARHIVEFRDLISIGTYNDGGRLRRWSERRLEYRAVRGAKALVTVSQPLADDLAAVYKLPVTVVQNGFDPVPVVTPAVTTPNSSPLRLAYCGEIYIGRRDPGPLFAALQDLVREGLEIRVDFYGTTANVLREQVDKCGLSSVVTLHDRVGYEESQRIQQASDVLVLLMWNDPREVGVYSGKLYEYIGVRRPILMLGCEDGVAATLIRERVAGIVTNDPRTIAAALREWADEKSTTGIPLLPLETSEGLSREDQARVLEHLLLQVAHA